MPLAALQSRTLKDVLDNKAHRTAVLWTNATPRETLTDFSTHWPESGYAKAPPMPMTQPCQGRPTPSSFIMSVDNTGVQITMYSAACGA